MTDHSRSDSTDEPRVHTNRRAVLRPTFLLMLASVTAAITTLGCGTTTGSSSGSCALRGVTFEGHPYRFANAMTDFTVDRGIGTSIVPPCDDTGGRGNTLAPADRTIAVFRVVGIDPTDGIAIRSSGLYAPDGFALLGRSNSWTGPFTATFQDFLDTHDGDTSSTADQP